MKSTWNLLFSTLAVAAMAVATPADAASITLIAHDAGAASAGNGALFSDPTGVLAPAAVGINGASVDSANATGRALDVASSEGAEDPLVLADITDNDGIQIAGFTSYRGEYISLNSAFGFLESGGRLSKPSAAGDGQGFANSNQFYLVSDLYSPGAFDSVSWEFLAGSDNGAQSTTAATYLFVDGVGSLVDTTVVNGAAGTIVSGTEALSGSTVQLLVQLTAGSGTRSLIDDIDLSVNSVIPEPGSIALSLLALSAFGAVGMRRRLG